VQVRVPAGLVEHAGQRLGEGRRLVVGHVEAQQGPPRRDARRKLVGGDVLRLDALDPAHGDVEAFQRAAHHQALGDQRAGGHGLQPAAA
jgi:hypothetical protein